MNRHADQLREAFTAHEHLAPDAAEVYAGAQSLARTYQRRRLTVRAAGGAVLGAGLVAGGMTLPNLPGNSRQVTVVQVPGSLTAATLPPLTAQEQEADWQAYFAAGYGYDDALKLAKIWNVSNEPGDVKAEAGRRLLAGETLPIQPSPDTAPTPSAGDDSAAVDAFFAAGYTYADAVKLAELWKTADVYQTKVDAGKKLLDGQTLPIAP